MKVLYVSTELHPLLKTGGLADVCAALPTALAAQGAEVRRLLPAFDAIRAGVQLDGLAMPLAGANAPLPAPAFLQALLPPARLLSGHLRASGEPVYLLDAPSLYQRSGGPYADSGGHAWPDNAQRFALLGWAAAWLGLGGDPLWRPGLVHAHDWHTGLTPLYLRSAGTQPQPATVFTVHNLAYQGLFQPHLLSDLGLPAGSYHPDGIEFHGQLSFMKAGLMHADAITTVSPRYASEILMPEQGCGLDGVLRARQSKLSGILNGVDYTVWNPSTDPLIKAPFDLDHLEGKQRAKAELQRAHGLKIRPDALLFGVVSRLTEQKGLHLLPGVIDQMVAMGGQLVVQGTGEAWLERALQDAVRRHGEQAVLYTAFDEPMAHRIVAGCDVLLMPSRFEPCGLTQLYAMRYGTLPLVHAVGGLADTVTDCSLENIDNHRASGFTFHEFTADALLLAVQRAFALRRRPVDWAAVQRQAMQLRFDWQHAASDYLTLFRRLTANPLATPKDGPSAH